MTYGSVFTVLRSTTHRVVDPPDPLIRKLRAFARLKTGWSYGRGLQIGENVIAKAEAIYRESYRPQLRAEAFPGTNGEVLLVFQRGDLSVHVTVNHDLGLDLRMERGIGFNFEDVIVPLERVDEKTVRDHIATLARENAWTLRESSTSFIITSDSDDVSIPLSKILPHQTTARSLLTEVAESQ
jgi:hypothetical protein